MALNPKVRPANAPSKLWVVLLANGERHLVTKELLGGMREWAQGQKGIMVIEYDFKEVVVNVPEDPPPEKSTK